MENNTKSSEITVFVDKNLGLIKKMELISFAIFLIGFICFESNISNSNYILIIGSILTAITLFLQAFKTIVLEDFESYNILGASTFINFIFKLYFFGLSVSFISLIGFVLDFKNGNTFAVCGGSTLIIILILTFFSKIQDKSNIYDLKFYLRIIVCLLFLGYLIYNKGIMK